MCASVGATIHARRQFKINVVRYADDFVMTGISKEILEHTAPQIIPQCMAVRGPELSEEKTRITVHKTIEIYSYDVARTMRAAIRVPEFRRQGHRADEAAATTGVSGALRPPSRSGVSDCSATRCAASASFIFRGNYSPGFLYSSPESAIGMAISGLTPWRACVWR